MLGGLTLPMVLSLVMIGVGVLFLVLARRSQPIGGLLRPSSSGS
jgi:hypothetical protein